VRRSAGRLVALALLGVALAACGKKGPPVAPELRLPAPPTGLHTSIDESSILVTWTNQDTRLDGTRLRDLTEVRLYRREDGDGDPLKPAMLSSGQVVGYDQIAVIRLDSPPATVERGSTQWVDRQGLVVGHRYVYVVTALDSRGRSSPPSERRAITFLAAPKPPGDVTATAGDHQVTLRWKAPAEVVGGGAVSGEVGYLVLRGTGSEGPLSLVTPQPVTATAFTDTGLDNDTEYRYAVRSVRLDPRATATGPPSTVVTASPATTTPPSSPSNLVAVPAAGAVRLAWRPNPEANVAFYAVHRAVGTGPLIRIGTTPARTTTFIDQDVRPGVTYRYAVTAIDNARRPNESAPSVELTVTPR